MKHRQFRLATIWLLTLVILSLSVGIAAARAYSVSDSVLLPVPEKRSTVMSSTVDIDLSLVPEEMHPAFVSVVNNKSASILTGTRFAVVSLRQVGDWALATLAVLDNAPEDVGMGDGGALVLARRNANGIWEAALESADGFTRLLSITPDNVLNRAAKQTLQQSSFSPQSPQYAAMKFPWNSGQSWLLSQGWHSGNNVDFAVAWAEPNKWVLAAHDGTVTRVCSAWNGGSANVQVAHADGTKTWYAHLDKNTISNSILGMYVPQGFLLGKAYGAAFTDSCGRSTGPHIHFGLPSRNLTIDGWTVDGSNIWRKGSVTKGVGSWFGSSNSRVNVLGYVDEPLHGSTQASTILVRGWAKASNSSISRIEIWINGANRGNATYGTSRPDVGGNFGYAWNWDTTLYSNGNHTLQVKAIAADGGSVFLPGGGGSVLQISVNNSLPPSTDLICDDGDGCFSYNGYWDPPSNPNQYCKYGGDMLFGYACWTSADCQPDNDNYSVFWRPYQVLGFIPGNYEVFAYISRCDSATPHTQSAKYYLRYAGDSAATAPLIATVNQAHPYQDSTDCSDSARWVSLGTHNLDSSTYLELRAWTDESGPNWGTRHHVIFADAVKLSFRSPNDSSSPGRVTDLTSGSGYRAGEVTLIWTAPGNNGYGDGPAARYDIRYSNAPINEGNWANAAQIQGAPDPGNPGSFQQKTVSGLTTGARWYFAIKSVDGASNWSALSNVPSVQDAGFRPNPHGYKFENYGGVNYNDYTIGDMRRMFGDGAVCLVWLGPLCWPKQAAREWNTYVNEIMDGGHCDGMASTSLRFFKGQDRPSDFQSGASNTHDLELGNARRHIAYYFVEQVFDPVRAFKQQVLQNSPSAILDQLRSAMSGSVSDPTTLFVRQAGLGGHAITPYAIEEQGNGIWWVWVYDNNWPDVMSRHLVINTTDNTWSYYMGSSSGTWSGNANSHTLGVVPISKYAEQPVCPWCGGGGWRVLNALPLGQVGLIGQGHLLIKDSQGRRIGYDEAEFVNEIPGAYETIIDGGLGIEQEPIYTLPLSDTYTILLDGQLLTQTAVVSVRQFGPGYAVGMNDVVLDPISQDQLVVAPDGMQLAYQASGTRKATMTMASDSISVSYKFQVKGMDFRSGQVVTLTNNISDTKLEFRTAQIPTGTQLRSLATQTTVSTYDLEIARVNTAGDQKFIHAGVVISPTDTHYVDYGTWNGAGSMTLLVDHGSKGKVDETITLANQAWQIYLPLVMRDYFPPASPQANFTATPTAGMSPLTVVFTNMSAGNYTDSLWDFGDGITSTLPNPTHVYTTPGVYTVSLTVSRAGGSIVLPGDTSTLTRANYITVGGVRADFVGEPTAGVAPLAVVFTNTSSGDYASSLWNFGDEITSTLQNPTHTYTIAGVYTVSLTVNESPGTLLLPGATDTLIRTDYITVYAPMLSTDADRQALLRRLQ